MMNVSSLRKNPATKKRVRSRTIFSKFCAKNSQRSGTGTLVATKAVNCEFLKNRLSRVIGVKKYFLPYAPETSLYDIPIEYGEALKFFSFSFHEDGIEKQSLMVETSQKELFVFDEKTVDLRLLDSKAEGWSAKSFVGESGQEKVCITSKIGAYVYDPVVVKGTWLTKASGFVCSCFFHERLFLARENTIRFSAPMQPEQIMEEVDGVGTLEIPFATGAIVAMERLGDAVYIFLTYGIAKLSAKGDSKEFVLEELNYSGEQIFGDSVCRYENSIYFVCGGGIRKFDGNKVLEIGHGLGVTSANAENFRLAFADGKLFLSYKDRWSGNKCIFLDLEDDDNTGEIFYPNGLTYSQGVSFCSINGQLLKLDKGGSMPPNASDEDCYFIAEGLDFGTRKEKWLRTLEIFGRGICELTLTGERGEVKKIFSLGEGALQEIKLDLKGKVFSLKISPRKGCEIEKIGVVTDRFVGGGL